MVTTSPATDAVMAAVLRSQITTFSEAFLPDKFKEQSIIDLFAAATISNTTFLDSLRSPAVVQQCIFINANGIIKTLVVPILATNSTNGSVITGSLANKLDEIIPVSFPTANTASSVLSIVPKALADELKLTASPTPPEDLAGPPKQDGSARDPPGYQRIHSDATIQPTFVTLPTVFPLPRGTPAPIGKNIKDISIDTNNIPYPLLRAYLLGHQYLFKYNNSRSLHSPTNLLFKHDEIDMTPFTTAKFSLTEEPHSLQPTMLTPDTAPSNYVMTTVREQRKTAYWDIAQSAPADPDTVSRSELAEIVKKNAAGTNTSRSTTTLTEQENLKENAETAFRWSIALCTVAPDLTTGQSIVVPATLKPQFAEFLKTTSTARSQRILTSMVTNQRTFIRGSDLAIDSSVSFNPDHICPVLCTYLKRFRFLTKPMSTDGELITQFISIMTFGRPITRSVAYQEVTKQNNEIQLQLELNEHSSKIAKKNLYLSTQIQHTTLFALITMICNYYFFMSLAVKDFDKTPLWQGVERFLRFLRDPLNADFFANIAREKVFFHNIAMTLVNVTYPFFTFASTVSYIDDVSSTTTKISASAITDAISSSKVLFEGLRTAVVSGQLQSFMFQPISYQTFFPTDAKDKSKSPDKKSPPHNSTNKHSNNNENNSSNNNNNNTNRDGSPRRTSTNNNGNSTPGSNGNGNNRSNTPGNGNNGGNGSPDRDPYNNKSLGFLTYQRPNGVNQLPLPRHIPVKKDSTGSNTTTICMKFAIQNRACIWGDDRCNFMHCRTFADIPADAKAPFRQYVNDTDGLSFRTGFEPPAGTNNNS